MKLRMLLMLAAVAVVLGGTIAWRGLILPGIIRNAVANQKPPAQTVSTVTAGLDDWQPEQTAIGTLRAVNGADLAAEVAGIVETIGFKSGDEVPAGQVLVTLRSEDDLAKLRSLEAEADLAGIVAERDRKQFQAKAIAQATLDADEANLKNARALAEQQKALVDKKQIRAPFAGRLGIRAVDLGQYLAAGTTVVTLQQIDPIFMDFNVPQQALAQLKTGAAVTVRIDAYPGETFQGEIAATEPRIDTATRNVQVRATLKNAERKLVPGMYGTVSVVAGAKQRLLTLPQSAIAFNTYGSTVYVVDDKGAGADGTRQLAVRQTFVTTGATRGDQIAVLTGIKPGDVVVTAGQIKLHNGSPVTVNNAVQPTDDPHPTPVER